MWPLGVRSRQQASLETCPFLSCCRPAEKVRSFREALLLLSNCHHLPEADTVGGGESEGGATSPTSDEHPPNNQTSEGAAAGEGFILRLKLGGWCHHPARLPLPSRSKKLVTPS